MVPTGGVENIITIVLWIYLIGALALFVGFYWRAQTAEYHPDHQDGDEEVLRSKGVWTKWFLYVMIIIMCVLVVIVCLLFCSI